MRLNIINIAAYSIVVFAILLVLVIAALLLIPPVIIKPNVQPYKIINTQVRAGDVLYYQADLCKYADTPAYVNRLISGQVSYSLPETTNHIVAGCGQSIVGVKIPEFIQPGKYVLHLDIRYEVNFIRHEDYHLLTQQFEVMGEE